MWEGSVERNCEPMNKNCIEGAAKQGERAIYREALVIKAKRRRCGGCAVKECVLTRGDLAVCLTGRRLCRREKSAKVVAAGAGAAEDTRSCVRCLGKLGGQT